ncbi:pseudaminic acid cytidylyltransferase [Campylobacter sp. MIT 21-1685]|uniref:pseudaminic acid cytidylyltransferase n=1 Tax=unclassified Campylobacter TaxID=2593542 RepID=UPI00224A7F72|nr:MULTISPECIES: pseudaminic acid cytidylyltransferase [unclassified Campylobacter]MCX2683193.1 pseudaminic acid cytidylyltransferase [Campylobacter sp. MIT 21-1684]MCX2751487.1 pseudaminic acid cytidylyltransferase [Campylobacter sp. MIT 21-1682]MCX2807674.1 pseudaminic acid cytidylyltransferase [Campylobacter sp. MIT 21-1685]
MKNLCIIPARGGSKRIPKKNIIDFYGKPLIAYSIENALHSGIFDEVFVSSDDEEIQNVALAFGAKVLPRAKELSDDYTPSSAVIKNAIEILAAKGKKYDNVCCLYATAPLLKTSFLQEAFKTFIANDSLFLFSATYFDFAIQRAFYLDKQKKVHMFDESSYFKRSQDLTQAYHDAGIFYFGKSEAWLEEKMIFKPYSSAFILPKTLVCDIDTFEDLEFAKTLFRFHNESTL